MISKGTAAALFLSCAWCGGSSPPATATADGAVPEGASDGGDQPQIDGRAPADAAQGAADASRSGDATASRDAASTGDATAGSDASTLDAASDAALAGWTLTWSDEFNGPDGSAVDPTKWTHEVGGTGWGNAELEYYTDGTQNAVVTGGNLVITATTAGASALTCSYGVCRYTSARLKTEGLFTQAYGRFEARIQLPAGQGLWPAFWALGDNIGTVSWPACGEIDIMEAVNGEPLVNHGTLHGPVSPGSGTSYNLTATAPATTTALSTSFHTYAVEWDPGTVRFLVDDAPYATQTTATLQRAAAAGVWEFDHPFFLLLNVAVGGNFPGAPDATTIFPQTMKVDWVRVYERTD